MSILTDLNPQAILAKVAIVGAVAASAYLWGHHSGYSSERAEYDLYVAQQGQKAEFQVAANKSALLFQQTQFQLAQAKIEKDHTDEVANLASARDVAVADSGHYAERLRYYLAHAGGKSAGVPGSAASAVQPATDSEGAGGLSDGISGLNRYLIQRFYTADVIAATLNEAIDVIAQDRAVCTGALPGINKDSK